MKQTVNDKKMVAYCGLYCGSCKKFLLEKCPGCVEHHTATWCKIRKCNIENNYNSCADCQKFEKATDCKIFNNFLTRFFSMMYNSDRPRCVESIKNMGYDNYAKYMAENNLVTFKRK